MTPHAAKTGRPTAAAAESAGDQSALTGMIIGMHTALPAEGYATGAAGGGELVEYRPNETCRNLSATWARFNSTY